MNIILRRLKLGRTSCKEIAKHMEETGVVKDPTLIPRVGGDINYLFRWGCTATITNLGVGEIVNSALAIHRVNDKREFREILVEECPDLVPKTWFSVEQVVQHYEEQVEGADDADGAGPTFDEWLLRFKVIVRPRKHAQGKELYLCDNRAALIAACARCGEGFYISEYIPKVAEYRVAVVSGRAVWVAKKTPADPAAIAWNVARGGRFDNVKWDDWPLKVVKNAIIAFNLSGLDFGGVDVMVDAEGNTYILEINSAPSQTSPYRQECMGKAFKWIVDHGKQSFNVSDRKGGYKKFIHPAVCGEAQV